jgi:hypothetical protein
LGVRHIPKENRRKLDAKAIKCIFIGYCSEFIQTVLLLTKSLVEMYHEKEVGNHDDNSHEEWQRYEGVKEEPPSLIRTSFIYQYWRHFPPSLLYIPRNIFIWNHLVLEHLSGVKGGCPLEEAYYLKLSLFQGVEYFF